jgi:hypothetical protein
MPVKVAPVDEVNVVSDDFEVDLEVDVVIVVVVVV